MWSLSHSFWDTLNWKLYKDFIFNFLPYELNWLSINCIFESSNMFNQVGIGATNDCKICKILQKTPVWNIPQVNRFIVYRW